ncbi:MAG: response regulator [Candidatus Omnitrophica bacterium]|nr:response regulator [Candidatus Omnitrophota bacterium]
MGRPEGKKMGDKVWKVLVADDEQSVTDVTVKRLKAAGFEAVGAYDGASAVELIKTENPDVVVLDLNMPRKDGFTVLKELRAITPPGRWVPVVIVSGRTELEDMRKGFDLEADHYLTKPCTVEEVVSAVRLMAGLIPLRVPGH